MLELRPVDEKRGAEQGRRVAARSRGAGSVTSNARAVVWRATWPGGQGGQRLGWGLEAVVGAPGFSLRIMGGAESGLTLWTVLKLRTQCVT